MSDLAFNDQEIEDLLNSSDEKEVTKAVIKEVTRWGQNIKGAYADLQNSFIAMKEKVDKDGTEWDEKLKRQVEDITTRQADLDKKSSELVEGTKKRMDELEAYIQRHGKSTGETSKEDEKLIKQFYLETRSRNDVNTKFMHMHNFDYNVEIYNDYCKNYETYLRLDRSTFESNSNNIKALAVGVDPYGGYTVTPTMSNTIMQRMFEMDPIRQLANVETISASDAWEVLISWGEFGFGWVGETESRSETDQGTLKKIRIPVHEMYANPFATQILVEDSGINIEEWIATRVADRFGRGEAAAFVSGNGVKQPRGFLTYSDYDTAGTDQFGRIERIAMGAAAALTADGFYDVKFSMVEDYIETGTWLMNRTTLRDTLKLKDGDGNYLWSPGLAENKYSTILGRPVRMATTMPAVAANALSVAYADWKRAYTIVDRLGISIIRDPLTRKPFIEFYTRKRVGGDVTDFQAIKLGIIST